MPPYTGSTMAIVSAAMAVHATPSVDVAAVNCWPRRVSFTQPGATLNAPDAVVVMPAGSRRRVNRDPLAIDTSAIAFRDAASRDSRIITPAFAQGSAP